MRCMFRVTGRFSKFGNLLGIPISQGSHCIRMLAFLPVINDQFDVVTYVRKPFFLLKKSLNCHLRVSLVNGVLFDRC